jgi:Tfp pilus assembly PilM family ATPase
MLVPERLRRSSAAEPDGDIDDRPLSMALAPHRSWKRPEEREPRRWLPTRLLARRSTALSVEGSALRVVATSNRRVENWSAHPLDDRAVRGSDIVDSVSFGAALGDAFDQLDYPRSRVAWGLSGFQTTARILELPGLRGPELKEAVEEEFERILGVSVDDFYLSWQRLEGRVRQRNVFAIAIPRTTVHAAIEALDEAGLQPMTMDLRPIALVRALGCADGIVANLEDGSLDVVIVERSVPLVIRSLQLVGAAANREAAQSRLIEEIERTLAFYDDSNPDRPLDLDAPLYLTGSLATGIGLAERLRAATRHPIGRIKPSGSFPPDFPVADYLVAIGLAQKRW